MFRPTTLLSLLLVLATTLSVASASGFDLEECDACVAQGCGYCYRKSKTSAYSKQFCTCDHQAWEHGAHCNDISMITDGEDYGRNQYMYGYNNGNNGYNNNNNNGDDAVSYNAGYNYNNYDADNYYAMYGQQYADDDHFEANASGGFTYKKARNSFKCRLNAKPKQTMTGVIVGCVLGGVALLGFVLYMCRIHCKKRALPHANEELLIGA